MNQSSDEGQGAEKVLALFLAAQWRRPIVVICTIVDRE